MGQHVAAGQLAIKGRESPFPSSLREIEPQTDNNHFTQEHLR
jgi:hypothetical protein